MREPEKRHYGGADKNCGGDMLDVMILDFYSDWCVPCRHVTPVLEKLCKRYGIRLLKINVEKDSSTASMYGVMSLPTIVLMIDNKPIDKLAGAYSEEYFDRWIREHLIKHGIDVDM